MPHHPSSLIPDDLREMLAAAINFNLSLVIFGWDEAMKKLIGWVAMLTVPPLIMSWHGHQWQLLGGVAAHWGDSIASGYRGFRNS